MTILLKEVKKKRLMTKTERRQIEREFFNYKSNREQAATYVASSAFNGFAIDYSHERVHSSAGNSVERAMINAISKEERAYKWCVVFQNTLDKYRWEQKDRLILKKYIERKPRWRICEELALAEKTYHRWLNDILETAHMWAVELGLI